MFTILIVDNNPTNRQFLVTLLGYSGHRLLEAADGAEALEVTRAERPDLIISDVLMPAMDGFEFVRCLRADPACARTPVIFYTATYHEREARALAQACGVQHILTKPIEPADVLSIVDATLGLSSPPVPSPPTPPEEFDREHLRLVMDKLSEKVDELETANLRLTGLVAQLQQEMNERMRAEEELRSREKQLSEAQRLAHVGSWEWDVRSNRVSWSEELYRIYGLSPQEFQATYEAYLERVHPDDRELARKVIETAYRDLKPFTLEERIVRPDGTVRVLQSQGEVIADENGQPTKMIGVCQDITERKQLEQRIAERTAQLEDANRDLEAFSYSVSHDLHAPLRAINGFSRILQKDYEPHLPPDARRYLRMIRDNTQRMGKLIDDLLAFARLGRQPLRKETVSPASLVRHALFDLRAEREGRRVEISIRDLPDCQADPALLHQVFSNLLSNALKFTRKRQVAVIEIGCREEGGERVYFVKDNGVGFDMRHADRLFEVFQRLHRAEDYEGTGVGLALVQRIIHRHGGRVWAEAEADRGATFSFTLENRLTPVR
jgi:PAS domain S-box-containing protein